MPQTVRLPNGQVHTFPDEATPEQIAQALGVQPPTEPSSLTDRFIQEIQSPVKFGSDILRGGAKQAWEMAAGLPELGSMALRLGTRTIKDPFSTTQAIGQKLGEMGRAFRDRPELAAEIAAPGETIGERTGGLAFNVLSLLAPIKGAQWLKQARAARAPLRLKPGPPPPPPPPLAGVPQLSEDPAVVAEVLKEGLGLTQPVYKGMTTLPRGRVIGEGRGVAMRSKGREVLQQPDLPPLDEEVVKQLVAGVRKGEPAPSLAGPQMVEDPAVIAEVLRRQALAKSLAGKTTPPAVEDQLAAAVEGIRTPATPPIEGGMLREGAESLITPMGRPVEALPAEETVEAVARAIQQGRPLTPRAQAIARQAGLLPPEPIMGPSVPKVGGGPPFPPIEPPPIPPEPGVAPGAVALERALAKHKQGLLPTKHVTWPSEPPPTSVAMQRAINPDAIEIIPGVLRTKEELIALQQEHGAVKAARLLGASGTETKEVAEKIRQLTGTRGRLPDAARRDIAATADRMTEGKAKGMLPATREGWKGETGKISPKMMARIAGAGIGAGAAPLVDPEDPGSVLPGLMALGALAPSISPRLLNQLRIESMLSGGAVPKNIMTATGAPLSAAWELGSTAPIKEMLRLPTNLKTFARQLRAPSEATLYAGGQRHRRLGPFGRTISAIDETARQMLVRGGLSDDEARYFLLTRKRPVTLEGPLPEALVPFQRTPFNIAEQGWNLMGDVVGKGAKIPERLRGMKSRALTAATLPAGYLAGKEIKRNPKLAALAPILAALAGPRLIPLAIGATLGGGRRGAYTFGAMSPVPEFAFDPRMAIGWPPAGVRLLERFLHPER